MTFQGNEKALNKDKITQLEELLRIQEKEAEKEKIKKALEDHFKLIDQFKNQLEDIRRAKKEIENTLAELQEKEKAESKIIPVPPEKVDLPDEHIEPHETHIVTEKIESVVEEAEKTIEEQNETVTEEKFNEKQPSLQMEESKNQRTRILGKIRDGLFKVLKKKFVKFVLLPLSIGVGIARYNHSPQEYRDMFNNWYERHYAHSDSDDPEIRGISALYSDSTNIERSTYDFLGDHKIPYKFGYYATSVFDLSDRTPPHFKIINGRENNMSIDSAAGITTNLFKKFYKFSDFEPQLKGHTEKTDEQKGDIPVIGYNPQTQMVRAGHYKEFDDNWMVSETYEIPLNFKLNPDSTLNVVYHEQALRMVPVSINENGKPIPFPIGVSYDKKITKVKPSDCTSFGTLEGGKVLIACGDKQIQVNGSFSDIYRVYERLLKEKPGKPIQAFLLDNGSYNLPIWDKDNTLTQAEITDHLRRNNDGGTALVLINDNRISPYEYKNKYKEIQRWTPNYTLDSVTHKPAHNDKTVIVIHHTANYDDPNMIIRQFEDSTYKRSAHVVIMKDGTRNLFNTDDYVLAHAGKSDFNNKNAVNYFSLGIEMEGDSQDGQFTVAQLESLLEYLRPRIEKYNISLENITTHKIIRDNYIKKHPTEKGIDHKVDLDDKVWEELQKLIKEKFYKDKKIALNQTSQRMAGSLAFQEIYRQTKNIDHASEKTREFLADCDVSEKEINETVEWIRGKLS